MGDVVKEHLLEALAEVWRLHPEWRLGQLLTNVAVWSGYASTGAVWDATDERLLEGARWHIDQMRDIVKENSQARELGAD